MVLLTLVVLVSLFGLVMVYNASVVEAFRDFGDKFHFAKLQAMWAGIGLVGLLIVSRLPLKLIKALSLPFFIATILLLIAVLVPGIGTKVQGARRWLVLGPLTIQPSELVKLSFVLYLAHWFESKQKFWHFLASKPF